MELVVAKVLTGTSDCTSMFTIGHIVSSVCRCWTSKIYLCENTLQPWL